LDERSNAVQKNDAHPFAEAHLLRAARLRPASIAVLVFMAVTPGPGCCRGRTRCSVISAADHGIPQTVLRGGGSAGKSSASARRPAFLRFPLDLL
jgi:hypothetical protein